MLEEPEILDAHPSCLKPTLKTETREVDIPFRNSPRDGDEIRAEKIVCRDGHERPGDDGVDVDKEHFKELGLLAFDIDAAVEEES